MAAASTPDLEADDWTSEIPLRLPVPALKQKAHDLFDPIWREDRLVSRRMAYVLLAAKLEVPEPQAHFKKMPRHRIEQAIALLPDLRAQIRRSLGTSGGGSQ